MPVELIGGCLVSRLREGPARRQMHWVENTGDSELRLLGVFYPSGSPAVRY